MAGWVDAGGHGLRAFSCMLLIVLPRVAKAPIPQATSRAMKVGELGGFFSGRSLVCLGGGGGRGLFI